MSDQVLNQVLNEVLNQVAIRLDLLLFTLFMLIESLVYLCTLGFFTCDAGACYAWEEGTLQSCGSALGAPIVFSTY